MTEHDPPAKSGLSRREALGRYGLGFGALAVIPSKAAWQGRSPSLVVDAHPHIYARDRKKYPPMAKAKEPGETASAEDLKRKMDRSRVARAVFIQTASFYGHDNRYLRDAAREHQAWARGVMTLRPDDPGQAEFLEDAVRNHNVRGLRGILDAQRCLSSPAVHRLWGKARELGIPVNCFVMDHLDRVPEIEALARRFPDLRVVIDHCFNLNTRTKLGPTLAALERLSALPNMYAKLTCGASGSARPYPHVDMHDPLKRVIGWFTPDRCVWGSCFPNARWTAGTSYEQNLTLFTRELGLSKDDQEGILSRTSLRLWFPEIVS